jgi:opacity protein-like surface antigen
MKKTKYTLIALLALVAASASSAQSASDAYYGEVGYLNMKFTDNTNVAPTPKLLRFVIGKKINENLAVEAMAGLTVSKGDWSQASMKGELSGTTYGINLKPKVNIANGTELFARVGVARTSWKDDYTGGSSSDSATKAVYGAGVQTEFSKNTYGQLDYMSYGGRDGWKSNGFTVSIGTRF